MHGNPILLISDPRAWTRLPTVAFRMVAVDAVAWVVPSVPSLPQTISSRHIGLTRRERGVLSAPAGPWGCTVAAKARTTSLSIGPGLRLRPYEGA
jgi:hypothetical protein